MLKTLIKKQLLELFRSYFIDTKTGKVRSKKGTAVFFFLFALLFLILGFTFYMVASGIGGAILGNGFNWLYFALTGLLSMILGVFGSVFNTYAGVYLPKDNELLMSLPIPNETLLLARLSGVYVTSLMYSALAWIPSVIAYWVIVPVNVLNIVLPAFATLVIALFVSVLSCILGWLVALVASKAKGKSFITVILSLTVFVVYYFVYFKIVGSISEILAHLNELEHTVKSWLHYSYLLGNAADGDALSMLLLTAITAALAYACFAVLSKTFTKLSTAGTSGSKNKRAAADYTRKTVQAALVNRELKHFTSVATWMLNGGFGLLLMPIATVVIAIKSQAIREMMPQLYAEMPQLYASLPILLPLAACLILSTNSILPVSISMEGKTLWQLQSLPLDPWKILRAKERMCVQLSSYPAILLALVGSTVTELKPSETVLVCIAVWLYVFVIADFGLFLNLKMPNFNWTNVAYLTKQSLPVVINMFGAWAFCAVIGAAGYFCVNYVDSRIILGIYIVLFIILRFVLYGWLKKKGTKIFASL